MSIEWTLARPIPILVRRVLSRPARGTLIEIAMQLDGVQQSAGTSGNRAATVHAEESGVILESVDETSASVVPAPVFKLCSMPRMSYAPLVATTTVMVEYQTTHATTMHNQNQWSVISISPHSCVSSF